MHAQLGRELWKGGSTLKSTSPLTLLAEVMCMAPPPLPRSPCPPTCHRAEVGGHRVGCWHGPRSVLGVRHTLEHSPGVCGVEIQMNSQGFAAGFSQGFTTGCSPGFTTGFSPGFTTVEGLARV